MISEYMRGVMYGDGHFLVKEGRELFLFSTTHKELSDKVIQYMDSNDYKYAHYQRQFEKGHENENYEILDMVESYDKDFHTMLKSCGFLSENAEERIQINPSFMLGYLETKGTIFKSQSRGSQFWRISFSGSQEDVQYIKNQLEIKLNIEFSQVVHRTERKHLGVVSESHRISTQARMNMGKLVEYLYSEDATSYLKQRLDGFNHFHATMPFNMKTKVYKHYKFAVGFMAREMDLTLKGIRGVSALRRQKPIFLWENDEVVLCFNNWGNTYKWICEEYKEKVGREVPIVQSAEKEEKV